MQIFIDVYEREHGLQALAIEKVLQKNVIFILRRFYICIF